MALFIAASVGDTHLPVVSTSSFSFLQGQGFIMSCAWFIIHCEKNSAGVLVRCQRSSACKAEMVPKTSPKLCPEKSVYGFSGTMVDTGAPEKRQAVDLEV